MRILAIHAAYDRPESNMLKRMAAAGHTVEAVCRPHPRSEGEFAAAGIRTTAANFRSRVDPRTICILRRKLREGHFDIVHSFINRALSNALIASSGMPVTHIAYRGTMGHIHRWDPSSWLTYLNPRVSRIVCVSNAVRNHLASIGIPRERLITIYKGHDPSWYTPTPRDALAGFGIPHDAFVVGFAGNMRPVKGAHVLLEAMRLLAQDRRIHLLLVGEVRYGRILKLASAPAVRERVHMTGFREDAPSLMGACDVFAMPSLAREGLPRAVIEAMSQGVPAIVSNAGGMPELVVDGDCGRVVPAGDPAALASAIAGYAGNAAGRRAHGQGARRRIADCFHANRTIAQTIALYESAMRNTRENAFTVQPMQPALRAVPRVECARESSGGAWSDAP